MSLDQVGYIRENGSGALLTIVINEKVESFDAAPTHRGFDLSRRRLAAHLVAAHGLKADRLQHMDTVNYPTYCRLPVNSFQYATRGGRGHHIIGDALNFHFRAREA